MKQYRYSNVIGSIAQQPLLNLFCPVDGIRNLRITISKIKMSCSDLSRPPTPTLIYHKGVQLYYEKSLTQGGGGGGVLNRKECWGINIQETCRQYTGFMSCNMPFTGRISITIQISGKSYVHLIVATLRPLYNGIYIIMWSSYMSDWVLFTFWLLYVSIMK